MFRRALLCAAVVMLAVVAPAEASPRHQDGDYDRLHSSSPHRYLDRARGDRWDDSRYYGDRHDDGDDGSEDSWDDEDDDGDGDTGDTSVGAEAGVEASLGGTVAGGEQRTITASLSGYSWADNTPRGSSIISMPVLHKSAGGRGTFADPITTAVPGSSSSPETPKGTRIYVARLKRYFIVEDSGATKESVTHFDLYVDGEGLPKSASDKCMNSYTSRLPVIINPPAGLPVTVGPLTGPNGCVI